MANEFIARKGLIVLANGAKITGSFSVSSDSIFNGPVTASAGATGSFTGSFTGDGSALTGIASTLLFSGSSGGSDTLNIKTEPLIFSGSNGITANVTNNTVTFGAPAGTVSGSSQIDHNLTTNYVANQHVDHSTVSISAGSGLSGGGNITATRTLTLDTSSAHFVTGARATISSTDTVGASGINLRYNSATGVISGSLVNSSVTVNGQTVSLGGSTTITANTTNTLTLGNGLTGTSFNGGSAVTTTVDTGSAHFTNGVKAKLNADGVVSSSAQIDVRNTIGIATIATTGSNTFTGVQTITNTTNSTTFANGALIVQGGVGITKDVNISGSLTVTGLLTAVSMSTQYVTSSQLNVTDNKITVQTNDLVRFGGLSVYDSGSSSPTTASIYWDSLNHKFLYENLSGSSYNSAIFIAGPQNTGTLGNEVGLTTGRVPVASGDDHIDSRVASSSIRVDFPSRLTHIEAGLYVTGAVTSSVGFSGDGSQLTGIVTNLNVSGSGGGIGTVALKTQSLVVSGSNGIVATANGQTLTISGSNASTTAKGVASFNATNFTVTSGDVASNPINFNGANINLGGTHAFGLQNITPYGASTTDQVSLQGGAIIRGVLYSSGSANNAVAGTTVIVSVATSSYDAAFFDYVVKSGTNYRSGTVMAVWDGSNNVEFTDTSTNDLGNTAAVSFSVDALSANARLKATVSTGTWNIKTSVRAI